MKIKTSKPIRKNLTTEDAGAGTATANAEETMRNKKESGAVNNKPNSKTEKQKTKMPKPTLNEKKDTSTEADTVAETASAPAKNKGKKAKADSSKPAAQVETDAVEADEKAVKKPTESTEGIEPTLATEVTPTEPSSKPEAESTKPITADETAAETVNKAVKKAKRKSTKPKAGVSPTLTETSSVENESDGGEMYRQEDSCIAVVDPSEPEREDQSEMSAKEESLLKEKEKEIEENIGAFTKVASALYEILKNRLYRGTHKTFKDYCREKWGFTRQHGYRLAKAGELNAKGESHGYSVKNEYEARKSPRIPKENLSEVMERAKEKAGGGRIENSHLTEALGEIEARESGAETEEVQEPPLNVVQLPPQEIIPLAESLKTLETLRKMIANCSSDERDEMLELADEIRTTIQFHSPVNKMAV